MDKIILVAFCGSWLISVISYIWYSTAKQKNEKLLNKVEELNYNLEYLQKENSALKESMKLSAKIEEKVNEKVENLHTGDSVANAINGLCKH